MWFTRPSWPGGGISRYPFPCILDTQEASQKFHFFWGGYDNSDWKVQFYSLKWVFQKTKLCAFTRSLKNVVYKDTCNMLYKQTSQSPLFKDGFPLIWHIQNNFCNICFFQNKQKNSISRKWQHYKNRTKSTLLYRKRQKQINASTVVMNNYQ